MTVLGLDEDWSKVDPAQAYKDGYRFAIGYLSQDTTGKNISMANIAALHAAHMDIGLVFEFSPQSALGGMVQGAIDARIAVANAQIRKVPNGVCLYAAVDFQVTTAQMNTVRQYLVAFAVVCQAAGYRYGAYGSYLMCHYLATTWDGFLWQTYAWSGGLWEPKAVLRQTLNGIHEAGAIVDRDESEFPEWGQWRWNMATDPNHNAINADNFSRAAITLEDPATFQGDDGNNYHTDNKLAQELAGIRSLVVQNGAAVTVTQDQLNAAVAANMPGLAAAVVDGLKVWLHGVTG